MITSEKYFKGKRKALVEAAKIRASADGESIVRIFQSPYGGYFLRVIPTETAIDMLDYMPTFIYGNHYSNG